ncbi:MAG: YceI family protein [Bacteroidetes bacterium]|jgi:hypothetical protein|nr:YceI family protein [Bacteroidota bacterium]MBU1580782.1 YceI family protein [Bacteroidota bacterium]MBU2465106.1 YceI family protein [Bacteroidota bacterium]MBU2558663.1 YceI family protein [Bacteroidota bacterium]MDA3943157.1 YceI family protein [Bacteroidota bacterium]
MKTLILSVIVCCLLPEILSAQNNSVFLTESGRVDFVSNAPLEQIKAGSSQVKGAIDTAQNTVLFVIENHTIEGFNSSLQQEHFHENYMETNKYQRTSFSGKIIEPLQWKTGEKQLVRAKGILDIHGIRQERIIKATLTYGSTNLTIASDFKVLLDDHKIRIPKVVSKKIATEIAVTLQAELKAYDKD